jgi:hypothetical protein
MKRNPEKTKLGHLMAESFDIPAVMKARIVVKRLLVE